MATPAPWVWLPQRLLIRADRSAEADPLNVLTSPLFECFQRNVVAIDEIGAPVGRALRQKPTSCSSLHFRPCAAHWRDNKASTPGE